MGELLRPPAGARAAQRAEKIPALLHRSRRPQTKLDRNTENGMAVCVGRLRPATQYDYKFVCLSHNPSEAPPEERCCSPNSCAPRDI